MLPLNKDSTISSKMSEYDNVPVLPIDYHNQAPAPFPVSIDDPCQVPQHRSSLSSSSTLPVSTVSPSYSLQCGESTIATPRLLQFPTEENQLPLDTEKRPQQQQLARLDPSLLPQDDRQVAYRQNRQQPMEMSSRCIDTTHHHLQHSPNRSHRESYGGEMGTGASMVFYFLVFLAEILMFGLLSLVLFWVVYYRGGFAWREDVSKEFNYHPVLMITGFIFFMGHAMLVYRLYRCCNKLTAKILHTFLYLMAVPCIVVGTITVFDSHNLRVPPIPNLYSLHSWLGVVTIGLFALQLVVGFFSFWILLCCEQGTAKFRAGLVPVHATFGIITFMLAIATAVTGYTEKAFFSLRDTKTNEITYSRMENEAIIINTQAAALAALGILLPVMLALRPFRRRWSERLTEHL